jgi:hypothetical protein
MRGKWFAAIAGLAVACVAVSPAQGVVALDFVPQFTTIPNVGGTVDIDIVMDTYDTFPGQPVSILGWGIDLLYDNTKLMVTNVVIGPEWDPAFAPDGDGLAGLRFPNGISGQDILLATVTVQGLAPGVWTIASGNSYPQDLTEGFALDPTGFEQVVLEDFAAITVLPEPTALALLALGGLVVFRRR